MDSQWYVTRVKVGQEARAILNLEIQDYTVYSPTFVEVKLNKGKPSRKALFPGYVFIQQQENQSVASVRSTYGVLSIVQFGGKLATLPNQLIAEMKLAEERSLNVFEVKPGDTVTIHKGPFAGLNAAYSLPSGEMRSLVLIDMLGKTQTILVDNKHISVT